jgi:hypothetical protein
MNRRSLGAVAALVLGGAAAVAAQPAPAQHEATPTPVAQNSSVSAATFAAAMRALWEDHVVWTRQFIVSALADLPDRDVAAQRLLRNQEDIGKAVEPFYGNAAGDQLTALLKGHITVAAALVGAAKDGAQDRVTAQSSAWHANADSIAAFLAGANPHWKAADLRSMMREHLDLTLQEAVARLKQDWQADVAAYDKVHHHILGMADALSSGIVRQFPQRFTPPRGRDGR